MSKYDYYKSNQCNKQQGCCSFGCTYCRFPETAVGSEGSRGAQGPKGEKGSEGPRGVQGAKGERGERGLQGEKGEVGSRGLRGLQGIQGVKGDTGSPGEKGETGPQGIQGLPGASAATIPFCAGKYGSELSTDSQGQPYNIVFSGFGSYYNNYEYLLEGEWASKKITIRDDLQYGTSFVVPYTGILRNIYAVFSLESQRMYDEGVIIKPFVCIGASNYDELIYDILEQTIVYSEPYNGGTEYPRHTLRKGFSTNIDVELQAGTLVAIIMGITAEGDITQAQYGMFTVSGGLYIR